MAEVSAPPGSLGSAHTAGPGLGQPPPAGKVGWPWTQTAPRAPVTLPDNKPWPRLTIVTPSYNQAPFLEETIRSVLLQGYPNLEYFVVDGGSSDGSLEIIRRYEPWLTRWVSEPDSGQAQAINKGLQWATGEIVAWLNSDDVYAPGALTAAVSAFARQPDSVLIYGDANLMQRDGRVDRRAPYGRPYDRNYLLRESNFIAQTSAFFRRTAFEAVGGLDETLHFVMDWDLWLRLERQGPIRYVPEVLSSMRVYPETKTLSGGHRMLVELKRMVETHGGQGLPAYYEAMVRWDNLARAFDAYQAGDIQTAQAELTFVLQILPRWPSDGWLLADEIASRAWSLPESADDDSAPIEFAERVCRHLPAGVASPARVRQRALGLLYQALALRSHHRGQAQAVRRYAWQAVAHDLGRLRNRGLLSVTARSFLGAGRPQALRP